MKNLFVFISLYFFLFGSTLVVAQEKIDTIQASPKPFHKHFVRSIFQDTRDVMIAPFHWNSKQWIAFAGVAAATVLISTQDVNVYNFASRNHSHAVDEIEKYGLEPWGSGRYTMGTMALFYGYGMLSKDKLSKKTALLGVKAYLISALYVTPVKQLFHRHRPGHDPTNQYIIDGPFAPGTDFGSLKGIWNGFDSERPYTSFPSGHTISVFSVATVVATEYKHSTWVPIVSYSIATLSGLSRVASGHHWLSDVFMGAAFGYAIGKTICLKNNWGVEITPSMVDNKAGVYFSVPMESLKKSPTKPSIF